MLCGELHVIASVFFILLIDARHLQGSGSRGQAGIVVILEKTNLDADGCTKGREYTHLAAACSAATMLRAHQYKARTLCPSQKTASDISESQQRVYVQSQLTINNMTFQVRKTQQADAC